MEIKISKLFLLVFLLCLIASTFHLYEVVYLDKYSFNKKEYNSILNELKTDDNNKPIYYLKGETLKANIEFANTSLQSRNIIRFFSFVLITVLILVGLYSAINKKSEECKDNENINDEHIIDFSSQQINFLIKTKSTGLIVALVGSILLFLMIFNIDPIQIKPNQFIKDNFIDRTVNKEQSEEESDFFLKETENEERIQSKF